MGVFAPLTGMVGAIQAGEAMKLIMGVGGDLTGRLLLIDELGAEWRTVRFKRDPGLPRVQDPPGRLNTPSSRTGPLDGTRMTFRAISPRVQETPACVSP